MTPYKLDPLVLEEVFDKDGELEDDIKVIINSMISITKSPLLEYFRKRAGEFEDLAQHHGLSLYEFSKMSYGEIAYRLMLEQEHARFPNPISDEQEACYDDREHNVCAEQDQWTDIPEIDDIAIILDELLNDPETESGESAVDKTRACTSSPMAEFENTRYVCDLIWPLICAAYSESRVEFASKPWNACHHLQDGRVIKSHALQQQADGDLSFFSSCQIEDYFDEHLVARKYKHRYEEWLSCAFAFDAHSYCKAVLQIIQPDKHAGQPLCPIQIEGDVFTCGSHSFALNDRGILWLIHKLSTLAWVELQADRAHVPDFAYFGDDQSKSAYDALYALLVKPYAMLYEDSTHFHTRWPYRIVPKVNVP